MYSRLKGKVVVRIIYVIFIFQIKMIVLDYFLDLRVKVPLALLNDMEALKIIN